MAATSSSTMASRLWFLLIVLSIIWGGSFLFARVAVQEVSPLTLVLLRVALAAFVLNILLMARRMPATRSWQTWRDFAVMGLLNNILPFGLIFYGQTEIGAGLAAIINAMTPIWTMLIANFATADEKLSANKLVGAGFGFVGVFILIGATALAGVTGSVCGQVAVLGATLSYGFAGVFGKRFAKIAPLQTARGQLTASSLIMLPVVLVVDAPWTATMPSAHAIWSVIALAIVCTALAYILFFEILAQGGAVNAALVTFLIPPSAIVMGIIFLGEELAARHIIGMAFIMVGLIIIDGRLLRRIRR